MGERAGGGAGGRIEALYAWVVEEPDGIEGIIGMEVPGSRIVMPMITSREAEAWKMEPIAAAHGRHHGCGVRLIRVGSRATVKEIPPGPS
jgi:hypothetical protein